MPVGSGLPWASVYADARGKADDVRRAAIEAALKECDGFVGETATALAISRVYLHRLLAKFELGEMAADLRRKAGAGVAKRGKRKGTVTGMRPRKKTG